MAKFCHRMFLYTCREKEVFMSNQVNTLNIPTLDNKKSVTFQQGNLPAMQGATAENVKHAVDKTVDTKYLSNRVNASKEADPRAVLGATAGTWYLTNLAMDKFGPRCTGDYNKTILGKLGGWGDTFCTKTWVGRQLEKGLRKIDVALYKLSKKSKIIYSLRNHRTKPEWGFAKVPGAGIHGFLAQDTEHLFEEFLKPIANKSSMMGMNHSNCIQKLEQYGMSQKEIDAFAQRLKGKPFSVQTLALQKKELSLLGADSKVVERIFRNKGMAGLQGYAQHLKVQMLGFKSMKEFNALKGKFLENPKKVIAALENAVKKNPNLKISIWRTNGSLGRVKNHFFGRTATISEYLNKYKATLGLGNKTKLGRFLPKALGWLTEGCTNRFAGGKLGVFMQAYIFGDMLVNTFNAPKGEKLKTLAERFVNDFSYFLALPLGMFAMHKVGGFKFAGLDKKGVAAYEKALAKLNAKNARKGFASKKAYQQAVKALNQKLGAKNIKNPITKLLHKVGKFINMGNQRIKPYKSASKWNLNWLRAFKNANILGVPLRIIIPMAMVSPFVAKWATKAVHAVFGRPTHSVLDDEPEEAQEPQQNVPFQGTPKTPQNQTEQTTAANSVKPAKPNDYEDTNLIKQRINGGNKQPAKPVETQNEDNNSGEPVRTYVPSPEGVVIQSKDDNTKDQSEPARSYIPSPEAVVLQPKDETPAQMALAKADRAEKYIQDTLKSM